MFDDKLRDEIIGAGEDYANQLEFMLYRMAFCVLRHYLGEEWVERNVRLQTQHNPFMLNEFDEESVNRFWHMRKVVNLGSDLFRLHASMDGFEPFCGKLKRRPIRSGYYETHVASALIKDGFSVLAVSETGVRGSDFDFVGLLGGERISIEVTAKDDAPFSSNSFRNSLNKKRSQVPSTNPAVLFVAIPQFWLYQVGLEQSILAVLGPFFQSGVPYNAVTLCWTTAVAVGSGMFFGETHLTFWNPKPLCGLTSEARLLLDTPTRSSQEIQERLIEEGKEFVKNLPGGYGDFPSFYEWYLEWRSQRDRLRL